MCKIIPPLFLIFLLIGCQSFGSSKVSGDVFIVTAGAGSYKLGAVTVKFYEKKRIDDIKSKGETPAYEYLKSDAQATSDADGKFTLDLPKGDYYAYATGERKVVDSTEEYEWLVPFSATQDTASISLNNQNLTKKF